MPHAPEGLRRIAIGTIAAAVLACSAANKQSEPPGSPPRDADEQMGTRSVEQRRIDLATADLPTLEAELDRTRTELTALAEREVGEAAQAKTETPMPASPDAAPRDRCTRVCELADHICALRDRICTLADEHEGEPRYEDACERAEQDCSGAREACRTCAE